jgi:hypothetical protein
MAKRLNISIPDPLFERIDRIKGNSRMNISAICQDALDRAVELEELKEMDIPESTKLIMRLQKEKGEYDQRWRELGFKDGVEDAHHLHYKSFMGVIEAGRLLLEDRESRGAEELLTETSGGSLPDEKMKERLKLIGGDPSFNAGTYLEGWINGVIRVWLDIKDKI